MRRDLGADARCAANSERPTGDVQLRASAMSSSTRPTVDRCMREAFVVRNPLGNVARGAVPGETISASAPYPPRESPGTDRDLSRTPLSTLLGD